MRQMIAFDCAGETLIGTLDSCVPAKAGTQTGSPPSRGHTDSNTGLLIVSGGNEIRIGAHRGMALLAARLAAEGVPVFRYDRRGIGDSTGENRGYAESAADLSAAAATFRVETGVTRLVGFGNCDAASALALFGRAAGIDAVILANPWVVERVDDLPPPAAIRARYAERLRDPAAWRRLLTGRVSLTKLYRGMRRVAARSGPDNPLAERVLAAIRQWGDAATVILAIGDATAIAYVDAARDAGVGAGTLEIATSSHSFARPDDASALEAAIMEICRTSD